MACRSPVAPARTPPSPTTGHPAYYFIGGLPYDTSLPFKATYQGYSYTDSVDPLASGQTILPDTHGQHKRADEHPYADTDTDP